MKDRQNTINGWVLFAGIVALGASIVTGEIFHAERPDKMGYPIEGVEVEGEGAEAEQPIAFYLASADAAKGEAVFKKCAACHNADPGGANALGPALFGTMGKPLASHAGFPYSDALKGVGGTWDWDKMSAWLANPKKFAPGTKMTFAGLSNPQDRADLMLWLNSKGGSLTVPPPPAATATASADKAAAEADDAGAQKAQDEPVLNEAQAAKGGRTLAGEAAPGEAVKQ
ncbi:MAG: cytochrome c family protein [Pseudomonadota bacterium]|nr:cytochrome c family protein [Pseudomonadota bacterium]